MAESNYVPDEPRALNMIHSLIGRRPAGVTFNEFMHSHPTEISSHVVVLSALDRLHRARASFHISGLAGYGLPPDSKVVCDYSRRLSAEPRSYLLLSSI